MAYGYKACLSGLGLVKESLEKVAEDVRGVVISEYGHWCAEERLQWMANLLKTFFHRCSLRKVYWRKHGHVVDTLVEMVRSFQFSKIVALIEKGSSHE